MSYQRPTRLLLVRHGESVANQEGRMQGWSDDPLSSGGEEQSSRLAAWLRANHPCIDLLVSSTLRRAHQTAERIGESLGLSVQTRHGLRELGLGQLEDVDEQFLDTALAGGQVEERYGVEPLPVFAERALGALFGLVAVHEGKTLLVVTHGGVIGVALAYWLDRDIRRTWIPHGFSHNTSLTELVFGERVTVAYTNRVDHLHP